MDCFVARVPRNDGGDDFRAPLSKGSYSRRGFDFNRPLPPDRPCLTGKSRLLRELASSPRGKNKSLHDPVEADLSIPHPASMKRGVTADRHET
jgi:hypothetical protein